ncbi:hypothetical protein PWYN_05465 [Paenibacillus wynnii]|uniref:Uncharacterized protein n=1 Tax=Paenibacillus wynnii TaxID=268407 RepID=A0A098M9Y7_9BACL|nr:hypothetical protein PWYN_05465 [Paenibacillus wynnii]
MLNYLENKYHKEFVVDTIEYTWNTSDYQLNLHLQSNEKIKFFAYLNSETGMMGDKVNWFTECWGEF